MFSRTRKFAARGRLYELGLSIIIPGGRSLPDLQKAFALRDNPFRLNKFFPDEMLNELRDLLETTPLRMAEDARLLPLYSDDVYPAETPWQRGTPFQNFQSRMRAGPRLQRQSEISRQAEERTDLPDPRRMMRWLLDCDGAGNAWHPIQLVETPDAAALATLRNTIAGFSKNRGVLCLIDDVAATAESEVLKVFNVSRTDRALIFFMTSSDYDVLKKSTNEYQIQQPSVIAYETRTLNPARAIKYCRHRMDLVRPADAPAWLARVPLFPFTEEIVTSSISSEGDRSGRKWTEMGTIDLAQLNVKFANALDTGRDALPADFDIATVSEADVPKHFLDPWPEAGREQVA
jgi:hypothetical protein